MIGPKKKVSKTQKNRKHGIRQTMKLQKMSKKLSLSKCSNCWWDRLSHRVCMNCGFYWDKQILTIKSKAKKDVIEA
jgi:large subunit ribosomal protein L32